MWLSESENIWCFSMVEIKINACSITSRALWERCVNIKWSWFQAWQVSQNKQHLVWLAGYCWVCVGVEKGWTFSQDVASLPSLRGSQEESTVPFNFLFVFVKATFPELGLQLVLFFLCCLRYSQLEGQENWSGKVLHVCHRWLQDGSDCLPGCLAACLRMVLAA